MFSEVRFINQLINSCSEIGETKTICKGGSLKKEEETGYFIQQPISGSQRGNW